MLRRSRFSSVRQFSLVLATTLGLAVVAVGQAVAVMVVAPASSATARAAAEPSASTTPWAIAIYPNLAAAADPATSATPVPSTFSVYAAPATGPMLLPGATRVIRFDGPAGSAPAQAEWNGDLGSGGNTELETYTASAANSYLDGNGHLVIVARRQALTGPDGMTRAFTSARLSTANKVAVQPGSYVEASITAPTGVGVRSVFSTVGIVNGPPSGPRAGGLDILVCTGATPTLAHSAVHMASLSDPGVDNLWGWGRPGGTTDLGSPLDAGPHFYGVYFDAQVVRFYVDRKLTMQITAAQAAASDRSWPFAGPQYLTLNIAVDSEATVTTSFPRTMTVGPIGVYSKVPFQS